MTWHMEAWKNSWHFQMPFLKKNLWYLFQFSLKLFQKVHFTISYHWFRNIVACHFTENKLLCKLTMFQFTDTCMHPWASWWWVYMTVPVAPNHNKTPQSTKCFMILNMYLDIDGLAKKNCNEGKYAICPDCNRHTYFSYPCPSGYVSLALKESYGYPKLSYPENYEQN